MSHVRTALALILALTASPVAWALPPPEAPRLDALGDPLPPGAVARIGTARLRGGVAIGALPSADGKLLVTTDEDRLVSLWDADGKEVRRFLVPYGHPQPLALSPDAKLLALNSYGQSFSLWDVATGKEVWGLGKDLSVSSAAFLADGESLIVAGSRQAGGPRNGPELVLRETATGKELRRFEGGAAAVRLSPDGKTLASATDRQGAALWDVSTGKRLHDLKGDPDSWMTALAFSPDGKLLAAGTAAGVVRRWEVGTGKEVGGAIKWWERDLQFVAFSPDTKELLTVNESGRCSVWDPATGEELRRPEVRCPGGERAVALCPDAKTLVTGGFRLRLWDLATGKERHPERPRPQALLAISPEGTTVATGDGEGSLRLWDGTTGKLRHTIREGLHSFPRPAFSPDGKSVAAWLPDGTVRQWEAASGKELRTLARDRGETRVSYSDDGGSIWGLSWPNKVFAWDAATGQLLREAEWTQPDGFRGWDDHILAADGRVLAAALSPPASSDDRPDPPGSRGVFLWDAAGGKLLRSMREPDRESRPSFRHLALSDNARFAAALGDTRAVHVWNADTSRHLWQSPDRTGPIQGVTLAPDGSLLASAGEDGSVRLWEVVTGSEVHRFSGHRGPAWRVAFSADGRVLASGGADGNVLIWDVTGQALLQERPAAKELPALWDDLSGEAAKAYRA
jgi:WD40 repeat protein